MMNLLSVTCRVIASSNRRKQFLACTLAGSTDDAVLFVSRRGFDAGHRNSWFMRDMDGDGRDDYCRYTAYLILGYPRDDSIDDAKGGHHVGQIGTFDGGEESPFYRSCLIITVPLVISLSFLHECRSVRKILCILRYTFSVF